MLLRDIINDLKIGDIIVCRCDDNVHKYCKKCGRIYVGEITEKYDDYVFGYSAVDTKIMRNDCLEPHRRRVGDMTRIGPVTSIEIVI